MRNNQTNNQSAAQSCSFTCTFLCAEEPLTTMVESLPGNVFACGEMYFRGKACSKNKTICGKGGLKDTAHMVVGKVCIRANVAHQAGAYPGFRSMK